MNRINERSVGGVVFRTANAFEQAGGLAHGFSTRFGGVSEGIWNSMNLGVSRGDEPDRVRENYRRFFAAIGASMDRVAMTNQVHEAEIRTVTQADWKSDIYEKKGYEADGLITDTPGVALVIFSADCLPILCYDPVKRVICAVHAGWRGTVAGIARRAVEKMRTDYGCRAEDILAAIGPGISKCHFETHAEVPEAVRGILSPEEAEPCITEDGNGKYHVDLKAVNTALLRQAGVREAHLTVDPECTYCLHEKYWSHRITGGERGSQGAVIQLL